MSITGEPGVPKGAEITSPKTPLEPVLRHPEFLTKPSRSQMRNHGGSSGEPHARPITDNPISPASRPAAARNFWT